MITPTETFVLYNAIKLHFTIEEYDFFKYHGKLKNSPKLEKRKDKHFFSWLSAKDDPTGMIIANVVDDPQIWVGNLLHEKAKDVYLSWKKRTEALTYTFTNEFTKLAVDFPKAFTPTDSYPPALLLYLQKEVSLETLVVTNAVMAFLPNWDKKLANDPVWKTLRLPLLKYRGFMDFEVDEFRKLILSILRSTNKSS